MAVRLEQGSFIGQIANSVIVKHVDRTFNGNIYRGDRMSNVARAVISIGEVGFIITPVLTVINQSVEAYLVGFGIAVYEGYRNLKKNFK